ncbi:ThiF family adenylyltransferase [Pseudohongiella nitratireducens]|uniref:ThiF family adenylyltransferase n=1 Tax=Pseudohongiella nitratireducens TaxID=1768907 RepID=UPI001E43A866|nr:ThiF family adenylyltransferase [Pseudohongiella nitratireducens]
MRDPSLHLVWPHVESDGVICLPSSGNSCNGSDLLKQAAGVFREALSFLVNVASDAWRNSEFQKEFDAYWGNRVQQREPSIRALISPATRSCLRPCVSIGRKIYVGDTDAGLRDFVQRMTGKSVQKVAITQALLIKLPKALIPAEMPCTAKEAADLISLYAKDLIPRLDTHIKGNKDLLLVVQAPQRDSVAYGGLWIPNCASPTSRRPSRQRLKGFRLGREPSNLLWRNFFSSSKRLQYCRIARFDDLTVCSRVDHQSSELDLADRHVALIGCGSVGSYIATMLAQSGLGHLTLVDPEPLASENL